MRGLTVNWTRNTDMINGRDIRCFYAMRAEETDFHFLNEILSPSVIQDMKQKAVRNSPNSLSGNRRVWAGATRCRVCHVTEKLAEYLHGKTAVPCQLCQWHSGMRLQQPIGVQWCTQQSACNARLVLCI